MPSGALSNRNLENSNGAYINMDRKFNIPAVNALYNVLTLEHLSHQDPRLVSIHKETEKIFRMAGKPWFIFLGMIPGGIKLAR